MHQSQHWPFAVENLHSADLEQQFVNNIVPKIVIDAM